MRLCNGMAADRSLSPDRFPGRRWRQSDIVALTQSGKHLALPLRAQGSAAEMIVGFDSAVAAREFVEMGRGLSGGLRVSPNPESLLPICCPDEGLGAVHSVTGPMRQ